MTDQRDDDKVHETGVAASQSAEMATSPISRRTLLRGVSAAVPTILTLSSGSAVAAMTSAALITASNSPEGTDYLCLSDDVLLGTQGGKRVINPDYLPLEDGDITPIPADIQFYFSQNGAPASAQQMCDPNVAQAQFWYKDPSAGSNGWRQTGEISKGMIASCDALNSFGSISYCPRDV